jgi:hypothetical protein
MRWETGIPLIHVLMVFPIASILLSLSIFKLKLWQLIIMLMITASLKAECGGLFLIFWELILRVLKGERLNVL